MATFTHGLNTRLLLDGLEITQFFKSAGIDRSKDTVETTAFGSTSKTFIPGLMDATASLDGMLEGSTIDAQLAAVLAATASQPFTFWPEGTALGNYGEGLLAIQTAYALSTSTDDVSQISAQFQADQGAQRVRSLHTVQSEAVGSANGTMVDDAASSATGAVGFLHVTGVVTSCAVKIQHSPDNSVWTDLITFPTLTSADGARMTVAGTVNRYVRCIWTNVGGAATFQCSLGRGLPTLP